MSNYSCGASLWVARLSTRAAPTNALINEAKHAPTSSSFHGPFPLHMRLLAVSILHYAVASLLSARLRQSHTPRAPLITAAAKGEPRRVWDDTSWSEKNRKDLPSDGDERARGSGRSRAAKRTELYSTLRSYSEHFAPLIAAEWRAEQEVIRSQLEQWPRSRLVSEGWVLMGLEARRLKRDFFGEPIVQLSLPPPAGRDTAPKLPFHRFTEGDVVSLCSGNEPTLPPSLGDASAAVEASSAGAPAETAVVLQRTSTQMLIVMQRVPEALVAAASAHGARRQRVYPFCLACVHWI